MLAITQKTTSVMQPCALKYSTGTRVGVQVHSYFTPFFAFKCTLTSLVHYSLMQPCALTYSTRDTVHCTSTSTITSRSSNNGNKRCTPYLLCTFISSALSFYIATTYHPCALHEKVHKQDCGPCVLVHLSARESAL